MKYRVLAVLAGAALALSATPAGALDTVWQNGRDANGKALHGLPAPGTVPSSSQATAPLLYGGHASGSFPASTSGLLTDIACGGANYLPQWTGSAWTCGPVSGLFTPDAPLVFGGSGGTHLQLTLDGTSLGVSAGALQLKAGTGAVTWSAGSTATTFGPQAGLSLLGVAGSSTGTPAAITATTDNQVMQMLGGSLQFHALDYSQLTGAPTLDHKVLVDSSDPMAGYLTEKLIPLAPVTTVRLGSGPSMAGLTLWLRADAGVTLSGSNVTAWADQSGSGNVLDELIGVNPTFVASAINGRPAVQAGSQATLYGNFAAVPAGSARTVIAVTKPVANPFLVSGGYIATFGEASRYAVMLGEYTSGLFIAQSDLISSYVKFPADPGVVDTWVSYAQSWDGVTGHLPAVEINGVARGVSVGAGSPIQPDAGDRFSLFNTDVTYQGYAPSQLAALFVYDHVLTPTEMAVDDAYIYCTYAIGTPVPCVGEGMAVALDPHGVDNTYLAQMPADTIKGNNTGSAANATDLSAAQATAMLDPFTSSLQGLVPASGGGAANYLRADGTWAPPPGTAGITSLTGPVTATGPGASATTVNLGASGISGSLPLIDLAQGGAAAGNVLEWSGTAWGPSALPSSLPPSGAAGGSLAGTYPNPTLTALVTGGSCTYCSVTLNAEGRATAYSTGTAPVTSVSGTSGQVNSSGGTAPIISLPNVGPGATTTGSAGISSITTDAQGRVTAAGTATYLTGNQTVTLSGQVTGSGTTSIATSLAANTVTYADLQQVAASSLLGNPTGSTANASGITLGAGLAFSGSTLVNTSPSPASAISGLTFPLVSGVPTLTESGAVHLTALDVDTVAPDVSGAVTVALGATDALHVTIPTYGSMLDIGPGQHIHAGPAAMTFEGDNGSLVNIGNGGISTSSFNGTGISGMSDAQLAGTTTAEPILLGTASQGYISADPNLTWDATAARVHITATGTNSGYFIAGNNYGIAYPGVFGGASLIGSGNTAASFDDGYFDLGRPTDTYGWSGQTATIGQASNVVVAGPQFADAGLAAGGIVKALTSPAGQLAIASSADVGAALPGSGVVAGTYVTPTLTIDATGRVTSASFNNTYNLVENQGTAITGESTLNFIAPLHAADSGGSPYRTNVTFSQSSPVTATYHWAGAFENSSVGLVDNNGAFVVPSGDTGIAQTSLGWLTAVSASLPQTVASQIGSVGTLTMPLLKEVLATFNGATFSCALWDVNATGSGTATLQFQLWYTTDAKTSGSYTLLDTISASGPLFTLQNIGRHAISATIPQGAYLVLSISRSDAASSRVLTAINYTCQADLYQ